MYIIKTSIIAIFGIIIGLLAATGIKHILERETIITNLINKNKSVIDNVKITKGYVENNKLYIHVRGDKNKKCERLISIIVEYGDNLQYRGSVVRVDELTTNGEMLTPKPFPVGKDIDFGVWKLIPDPRGRLISILTIHECKGELIKSDIGLFSVGEYIK